MPGPRTYFAIDLKSYYASAECAARGLDLLTIRYNYLFLPLGDIEALT